MRNLILSLLLLSAAAAAADLDVAQRLEGFDAYMAKTLKDWNAPGVGVGVVVGDQLVFAKGYGYRDYEKKLPYTPGTMSPIASNTDRKSTRLNYSHVSESRMQ